MATRLKKDDKVVVIAGSKEDKGKVGRILVVDHEAGRVVVEGVNVIKRHQSPRKFREAGIVEKEAPLHLSNVMVLCPTTNTRTRVGRKVLDDGRHVRVSRKSGEVLDG